jgi:transposase-like protein
MSELKSLTKHRQAVPPYRLLFLEDFKRDAVRLVVEEKYTFAAAVKSVGVSTKSLRDWHQKYAPQPEPCGEKSKRYQTTSHLNDSSLPIDMPIFRSAKSVPYR